MRSLSFALAACVPLAAFGQPKAPALPDGPGKEQVQQLCSGCHGLNRVMNSLPAGVLANVSMMIDLGVPIPPTGPRHRYLAKTV
jgi:mono/diheme cytochrome c family protein